MRIVSSFPLPAAERARLGTVAAIDDGDGVPLEAAAFLALCAGGDGVLCAPNVLLAASALGPKVRVVSTPSTGVDHLPVADLRARGIAIGHTRDAVVAATADLTLALVLATMRRIPEAAGMARNGAWHLAAVPLGDDLEGATLGIVGCGAIGIALARRAQACGMRVVYHNRRPRADDDASGLVPLAFEELLARADCVVSLLPLTAATAGRFDDAAFARMRRGAYFVNAGRGGTVLTDALVRATDGHLGGAAVDVTDPEPLPAGHPLLARPNVLVTPHIGTATRQSRARMVAQAVDNVLAGVRGEPLPYGLADA